MGGFEGDGAEGAFVTHLEGLPTRYIGRIGRLREYEAIRRILLGADTLNNIPDNLL
ncbi:hypothetical protein LBMAG38_22670 [Chloroflexota bacterium]|nr:hypothetical protein LBMAG38_22670 [Chloroflexota bacterium]